LVLHTTYVLRVQYSCGVVLVFWFWQDRVFGVMYVLSVQYSCAVVSVFWLWPGNSSQNEDTFLPKNLIGLFFYDPLADVCISYDLTLFYSVSFYFVYFSCTAQIHKLKFKSEYYLRINIGNCVKNANTGNHTLIS
jgi:hypothetical protein